jgi:hypothetical protein
MFNSLSLETFKGFYDRITKSARCPTSMLPFFFS